jgi:hypothetical protein
MKLSPFALTLLLALSSCTRQTTNAAHTAAAVLRLVAEHCEPGDPVDICADKIASYLDDPCP